MMYVEVENGTPVKVRSRPRWFNPDGSTVDDSVLVASGIYPVVDEPPSFDEGKQKRARKDVGEWVVNSDHVDTTYTVTDKTVAERKQHLSSSARQQFQASIQRGFSYDGGTWAPMGVRRQRALEIVAGINAGRGLPQAKTSLTFTDVDGGVHEFDETQIKKLAAKANDLLDAADDRLRELYAQIDAATTQDDLDNIDVTEGWPN